MYNSDLCIFMLIYLVAQMVKRLPAMWETWVRSLGGEDALEKDMATHSSTLAWKIPWTEEPCRLQSMGSQRVGHNWATSLTSLTQSHSWLMTEVSNSSASDNQAFSHWTTPPPRQLKSLYDLEEISPHHEPTVTSLRPSFLSWENPGWLTPLL